MNLIKVTIAKLPLRTSPLSSPRFIRSMLLLSFTPTTMIWVVAKSSPMFFIAVVSQALRYPPSLLGLKKSLWRAGVSPMTAPTMAPSNGALAKCHVMFKVSCSHGDKLLYHFCVLRYPFFSMRFAGLVMRCGSSEVSSSMIPSGPRSISLLSPSSFA